MIMPTIAPGRKMMPVAFVASISGIRACCSAVRRIGATGRPAGSSLRAPGGLDLRPLGRHVVPDPSHREARGVHEVADNHPPEGNEVPGGPRHDPEREQQSEGRQRRRPDGQCGDEKRARHPRTRRADVQAAKRTIPASNNATAQRLSRPKCGCRL
jgi:hypothetical protein